MIDKTELFNGLIEATRTSEEDIAEARESARDVASYDKELSTHLLAIVDSFAGLRKYVSGRFS